MFDRNCHENTIGPPIAVPTLVIACLLIAITVVPVGQSSLAQSAPVMEYENTLVDGIQAPVKATIGDDGLLYISQPSKDRVSINTPDGYQVGAIHDIDGVTAIAVQSGRLYAGSGTSIGMYDVVSGAGVGMFDHEFLQVNDIEMASGGLVYVADGDANRIKVFDLSGVLQFEFGGPQSGDGELRFPVSVALDEGAELIFVGDQGNSRVAVYSPDGTYLRQIGRHTYYDSEASRWVFEGTFTSIQGVTCGNDDQLYVVDSYQGHVQVLDYAGNCRGFTGGFGNGPGKLKLPMDAVYGDGRLFVTSRANGTVEVYSMMSPTDVLDPGASDGSLPSGFHLSQNYPNPFNPSTNISFTLARSGEVKLSIYNVLGQHVISLVDRRLAAGRHDVQWFGSDHAGRPVASGVYLYRLAHSGHSQTRQMILVK